MPLALALALALDSSAGMQASSMPSQGDASPFGTSQEALKGTLNGQFFQIDERGDSTLAQALQY